MEVMCQICSVQPAVELCLCSRTPYPVCNSAVCKINHRQKSGIHLSVPSSLHEKLKSLEHMQQARDCMMRIQSAEEWLNTNLEEINKCEADIKAKYQNMVRELTEYQDKKLQTLQELRERMREAIVMSKEEVTAHLLDHQYHPISKPAKCFHAMMTQAKEFQHKLFDWEVSVSPIEAVFSIRLDDNLTEDLRLPAPVSQKQELQQLNDVGQQLKLGLLLQQFVTNTLTALDSKPIKGHVEFFDEELTLKLRETNEEYERYLSDIKQNLPSSLFESSNSLSKMKSSKRNTRP